jgi:TonB-linked SusC/RagA family outer membrane protein
MEIKLIKDLSTPITIGIRKRLLINIMKTFIFLFSATVFSITPNNVLSQNTKIKIDTDQEVTIDEVFDMITKQTKYAFMYQDDLFKNFPKVQLKKGVIRANKLLKQSLSFGNFNVVVTANNTIFIKENVYKPQQQISVSGKITDQSGQPLPGVTVQIKGATTGISTNFEGNYTLTVSSKQNVLVFSALGFATQEITVGTKTIINVTLAEEVMMLDEVLLSTGYQKISKERATGSFEKVSEKTLKHKMSQNILDKIIGETSGITKDTRRGREGNLIIRGLSSFKANTQPLVVVDGFPVEQRDINSINPNDVKSITILKDAAAASIWGIRATNGVIVIVTKSGNRHGALRIDASVTSSFTPKADIFAPPVGSPEAQIDFQKLVFGLRGDYIVEKIFSGKLSSSTFNQMNPIIETLALQELGYVSAVEATLRLQQLAKMNVRKEYSNLILRPEQWRNYNITVSGGGDSHDFRTGISYNRNENGYVGVNSDQLILNFTNNFDLSSKLKARVSINYATSKENNNTSDQLLDFLKKTPINSQILDAKGNYVPMLGGYRDGAHTALGSNIGTSQLALSKGFAYPWTYNIKQEYDNADDVTKTTAIRLQAGLDYELLKNLKVSLGYQYLWEHQSNRNLRNENTFYTRSLVNKYTQVDATNNAVGFPIPKGSILDQSFTSVRDHTIRTQLNYDTNFKEGLHQLTAIAGYELRKRIVESANDRKYGYNDATLLYDKTIDFNNRFLIFPLWYNQEERIPNPSSVGYIENRFISYYANAAYTYDGKYTLSASTRLDDTNLFGKSEKYKNIPLYSVGVKWNMAKELFKKNSRILSTLQLRATYGANGNVSRETSPFLQIKIGRENDDFAHLSASIGSLPNLELRLEKTRTTNIGIDFSLFNDRISGTVDYYRKNSEHLLAPKELNATLGVNQAVLNIGELRNTGIEASLNVELVNTEKFRYNSRGIFNINNNIVTKIKDNTENIYAYLFGAAMKGEALGTIYAFQYKGLDKNGKPQFLDEEGKIVDYKVDVSNYKALKKMGTRIPIYYGSWINEFSYNNFSLRALTTFTAGHVFSYKNSFAPLDSYTINSVAPDFEDRWQKPGDENKTDIPAFPASSNDFYASGYYSYQNSDKFYDSATNIRLRQISLGYSFEPHLLKKLSIRDLQIGLQVDNVYVWNFNKWGIDPENTTLPQQPTYSFNIKASF